METCAAQCAEPRHYRHHRLVCRIARRGFFRRVYFWLERHRQGNRRRSGKTRLPRGHGFPTYHLRLFYLYHPAGRPALWPRRSTREITIIFYQLMITSRITFSFRASLTRSMIFSFWNRSSSFSGATLVDIYNLLPYILML